MQRNPTRRSGHRGNSFGTYNDFGRGEFVGEDLEMGDKVRADLECATVRDGKFEWEVVAVIDGEDPKSEGCIFEIIHALDTSNVSGSPRNVRENKHDNKPGHRKHDQKFEDCESSWRSAHEISSMTRVFKASVV